MLDRKHPLPLYYQLKEIIKKSIREGQYKLYERIPSENQLVAKYGVSRNTVRQALTELVNEGWLFREQGKGTFCSPSSETPIHRTRTIGMISPVISNYIFPQIVRGIDDVAHARGYSIILAHTGEQFRKEAWSLKNMLERKVDGLIIEPTRSALPSPNISLFYELQEKKIPMVMLDSYIKELSPSYVKVDDVEGARQAVEYLIGLGHRRIACVYKSTHLPGVHRFQGYCKALKNLGIELDSQLVKSFPVSESERPGYHLTKQLIALGKKRPTAIFFYNDQTAVQSFRALREIRLKVPEDISIIGFDDSEFAIVAEVPLTSVVHPKYELGKRAAEILLSFIENGNISPPVQEVMKPKLIIRDSCAPPKNIV